MLAVVCLGLLCCCSVLLFIVRVHHQRIKAMETELRSVHDDLIIFKMDFDSLSEFSLKHVQHYE